MDLIQQPPKINRSAFEQISRHVNETFGINLTEAKLNLVENRLSKRLKSLKMSSYKEYIDHIFGKNGKAELDLLRDFLSTNKTYFYRESAHFTFLQSVIDKAAPNQSFSVWSAACSAGDEVYTLSSIFEESSKKKALQYNILGTDISSQMIEQAQEGKYVSARVSQMPSHLLTNYFDKKIDDKQLEWYNVKPSLKRNVRFRQFNLIKDIPGLSMGFDIIFCRNVLIYFKEETKLQVVRDMIRKLKPGGYLILGHCEGMLCRGTDLVQLQPSVFQKPLV